MEKIIIASRNKGKLNEISQILSDKKYELVTMDQVGFNEDVPETGTSFEENALIKAKAVHDITGGLVIADDSGLVVDYLGGAPGIYSSRFAGENSTDKERNDKLLKMLDGVSVEKRTARFICTIAVIFPNGKIESICGKIEGRIATAPVGSNGFGYDPLFFIPEYNMTMAQMPEERKNEISHRGKALAELKKILL